MKRVYLDNAATTPAHPKVAKAILPFLTEIFGNPSSMHHFGREARKAVDESRDKVASLLNASPEEIVFTSGGTEADNFALIGAAFANKDRGRHIITTAIEHHAILHSCDFLKKHGFEITILPVEKDGIIRPETVKEAIRPSTILVSVMHANNEIGTIQPISEISEITKERNIYLHTDAVQTVGHIPTNINSLGVDLLSLSAHKLYGPKGVGALFIKKGTKMDTIIHGGGQERGRRAGTENIPGIVGLGTACEIAQKELEQQSKTEILLRDKLIDGILKNIPESTLNGHPLVRLPNNVNVSIRYVEGESILLNLDMMGIAASSGSACASGSMEPSHVLTAIGVKPEIAHGSIRFTLGRLTTEKDIEYALEVLIKTTQKLRSMSPLYRKV